MVGKLKLLLRSGVCCQEILLLATGVTWEVWSSELGNVILVLKIAF
jgi:hypothetical protein